MPIDAINPDEYLVEDPQGSMLPKARKQAAGGALTQNVQSPRDAIAAYRAQEAALFRQGSDLYNSEPDLAQHQAYARQRASEGEGAMLNALAAQFAGESFQPIQAQFLKKAAAAQEPMKVGNGIITAQGQYLKDPTAERDRKAEFLLRQAQIYGNMALNAETKEQQAQALAAQRQFENALKTYMAETGRMNAVTAAGGGAFGAGQASQIGSGPNNEPVFRQRNGQLFSYDASGQPVPYAGQVLPKANSSQPTEDERKAAGWFFQADLARRNMLKATQASPNASMPTYGERGLGMIPGVGEDIANTLRSADRQRFVQAASSFAEATLRAATGAGVNKDEALQKVRELTPQIGDKPENVKQKIEAQEMYLQALRTRANRALPQAGAVMPGSPAVDPNDPDGFRAILNQRR